MVHGYRRRAARRSRPPSTPVTPTEHIASLPLASQTQPGVVVTIGEVAEVELVAENQTSITRMNGEEALSISITAIQGGDVVARSSPPACCW